MRTTPIALGATTSVLCWRLKWLRGHPADREGERVFGLFVTLGNPRAETIAIARGIHWGWYDYHGYRGVGAIEIDTGLTCVMLREGWLGHSRLSAGSHETAVRRAIKAHAAELARAHKFLVRRALRREYVEIWHSIEPRAPMTWERRRELAARCRELLGAMPTKMPFTNEVRS